MKKTVKRIAMLLTALCLLFALTVPGFAAGQLKLNYNLTANGNSSVTVKTGDTITVTFAIKRTDNPENFKLNAMDNDIEYDSSFFAPVGTVTVVCGGQAAAAFDQRLKNDQPIVRVNDMACSYDADQTICTFQLKVIGSSGSSVLRCSEELAYDTNGNPIAVTSSNLTVTISGGITPSAPGTGERLKKDCPRDASCPIAQFTDTANDAWWHDGIHYCVEHGLMNGVGDGLFDPNGTTSRAMIVTMLWRMEDRPATRSTTSFKDVSADAWYAEAVRWAQSTGIVKGYDADSFGPDDDITREQLAAILYRYAEYLGVSVSQRADLSGYSDTGKISAWAAENMQWANAVGLVTGRSETTLVPQSMATRAEAATVIARFAVNILGE